MGRIEKIVINNFKSYSGEQSIGPFADFTCIIGPNGAGKSNIMDAICFVLGIAAKGIRAHNLKDLIFRIEGKPAKATEAKVTIHYVVGDGEIEGLDAGEPIRFARTVTAKGTSEYSINETVVSADKYADALREIGVDTKSRNFLVFQGDVESLAGKDPREMLAHFELVSGSAELKVPYEEAQTALEEARRVSNSKIVVKKAALADKAEKDKQKASADKFIGLREQVDRLQVQVALTKLFWMETQITQQEAHHEEAAQGVAEAAAAESKLAGEMASSAKAAAVATKTAVKKTAQAEARVTEVLSMQSTVLQLEERLKTLRGRLTNAGGDESAAAAAAKQAADEVRALEEEVENLQEQVSALDGGERGKAGAGASKGKGKGKAGSAAMDIDGEGAGDSGVVTLGAADRTEYSQLRAQLSSRTVEERVSLERLAREQENGQGELNRLTATVEAAGKRADELAAALAQRKEHRDKLAAAVSLAQNDLKDKQSDLRSAQAEHKKANERMQEVGRELEDVKSTVADLQAAAHKSDAQKKEAAATDDMKRLFGMSVRGKLSDLIHPVQRKYNVAVSVALGKHADAVVVNTEAVAHECIRFLRERKIRPMTFLPLDTLQPKEVAETVMATLAKGGDNGGLRLGRTCVSYDDPSIDKAVAYAFGDSLLCDELNFAMNLRYKKGLEAKIITLDGTIVAKNGNITGGAADGAEARGAARWDEKTLKAAEGRRAELLQEEESLRRKLARGRGGTDAQSLLSITENTESEIANLNRRLDGLNKNVKTDSATLDAEGAELTAARKEADDARPKLAAVQKDMGVRAKEMTKLQAKVDSVADGVYKDLCARLGLASIRDYESKAAASEAAVSKTRAALHDTLSKYKSKLDFQRSMLKDAEAKLAKVRKEGGDSGSEAAKLEKELLAASAKVASCKAEEAGLRAEAEAARAAQREAEASRDRWQVQRQAAQQQKAASAKIAANAETALESLRLNRHDLLSHAQMDKVNLPVKASIKSSAMAVDGPGVGGKKDKDRAGRSKSRRRGEVEAEEAGAVDAMDGRSGGVFTQTTGASQEEGTVTTTDILRGPSTSAAAKDKERSNRIDFDSLDDSLKELSTEAVDKAVKRIENEIATHVAKLATMTQGLNLKAGEELEEVSRKAEAAIADARAAQDAQSELEKRFASIKDQRQSLLVNTVRRTAEEVDGIYKELTRTPQYPHGGHATLRLQDETNPLDSEHSGITFSCQPAGKNYNSMAQRSGGEKTMATLALLYAIQCASRSPFFIMDEIDAALDNVNVQKISDYARRRSRGQGAGAGDDAVPLQCIVISLKDVFYCKAERLFGVYRETGSVSSKVMSIQLTTWDVNADSASQARTPGQTSTMTSTPNTAPRSTASGLTASHASSGKALRA